MHKQEPLGTNGKLQVINSYLINDNVLSNQK